MNDNATAATETRLVTNQRFWGHFRDCRKKAYWRFVERLEPVDLAWNLRFHRLIVRSLGLWHKDANLREVLEHIDSQCGARATNAEEQRAWHLASAMMTGYSRLYGEGELDVISIDERFRSDIVNPATGAKSRSFAIDSHVNGLARIDGRNYLVEHRTTSTLDEDYLQRLWADFQVTLRANYIEKHLDTPISGVVYDILVKSRLRQSAGETAAAFATRKAALLAKSKSGKTKAKRQLPESDAAFAARLAAKYCEPGMFHREIVDFDAQRRAELSSELWELTQSLLDARRRDAWYQNTSFCFHYRRPCEYLALCQSGGAQQVKEELYRIRPRPQATPAVSNGEVAA